jgi:two-component system, OmpR family, KDP operon response regulator KdpE
MNIERGELLTYSPDELIGIIRTLRARDRVLTMTVAQLARMIPDSSQVVTAVSYPDLRLDFSRGVVEREGRDIRLTGTENRILRLLATNIGVCLPVGFILSEVWDPSYKDDNHLLRVNICRARKKMGESATSPRHLWTTPKVGYALVRKGAQVTYSPPPLSF